MLQDFRESMKGTAFFIVIIIIIPFAFVGIDSIFSSGPSNDAELEVNGENIPRLTVDRALAIHKQRLLEQLGDIDPALLDDEMLRGAVRQRLIREKAAQLEAQRAGMAISPVTIASLLQGVDAYQTDAKFDREKYQFTIRQMGYTPREHHRYMNEGLLLSQFASGVVDTGFVTDADLELAAKIFEQRRSYYYLTLPIAPLMAATVVEDAEIKRYYDSHQNEFQTEEQVEVDYIELSVDDLIEQVEVSEDAVRAVFDARQALAQSSVRRQVEHILVEHKADGSHTARIAEIQKKLSEGREFAALAREYSDDLGSAGQGGALGFVEQGSFPPEFETALLALAEGDISDPVETDSGTHLIRLAVLEAGDDLVFDKEKSSIKTELSQQRAAELLPEKIEQLRELSYNAASLSETAATMGLKVATTEAFSRRGGQGLAVYPAVVNAAFSDDVLNNAYTSDVLELSDTRVVVLKVREHYPLAFRQLDTVSGEIRTVLQRQQAQLMLQKKAKQLQDQISAGKTIESLAQEEGLAWQVSLDTLRFDSSVDEFVRDQAFKQPAGSVLPSASHFESRQGDYVILSLTAVQAGELGEIPQTRREALAQSAARTLAQREYQSYESLILADAGVKMDR